MPRDKGRSGRKKRSSGARKKGKRGAADPDIILDLEAERAPYRFRLYLFTTLTAAAVAGAVLFASQALKGAGQEPDRLRIEAGPCYTVRLRVAAEAEREAAEALLRRPAVVSLAKESELFLCTLPDGKIALCAGRFRRSDDPSAQALLERVKGFELRGLRVFDSAHIGPYDPPDAR